MRTNIVIDPGLLDAAMRAGPYKTKKDAVEAGLKLLARQAAYREILRWEGKLPWDAEAATATVLTAGDDGAQAARPMRVQDGAVPARRRAPR